VGRGFAKRIGSQFVADHLLGYSVAEAEARSWPARFARQVFAQDFLRRVGRAETPARVQPLPEQELGDILLLCHVTAKMFARYGVSFDVYHIYLYMYMQDTQAFP